MKFYKINKFLIYLKSKINCNLKRKIKNIYNNILQSVLYFSNNKINKICKVKHVVFVCTGNICRSAFAEHALRCYIKDLNVKIESCGLRVCHQGGSPIEAVIAAHEIGVNLKGHQAKSIEFCDLKNADLIVLMDYGHYEQIIKRYPEIHCKVVMMKNYSKFPSSLLVNIYDPYGLNKDEYIACFYTISKCLINLKLRHL